MSTALLADADSSIKAGEWDQALEQLESLKGDEPGQPEVYEKLIHVLSVRGKFKSVVSTYLELLTVLVEGESLDKADDVVGRVLSLSPESIEARERRIEVAKKRGDTPRAVELSRELARLCIEQGEGDRSIRLLQDAQQEEPENLDIALELAEMYVSHGHIQDGANQYRKVANAFQEAGNIAKAAEAYRRMKVVQSDDPTVLLTLGRLYTELGKLDEAEQEFRSVLRHDLDHEEALLELGLVCQLKGRFRSGILAFNKVLQNNPGLVHAKRKLGELHHSQGMIEDSVEHFLQAAQGYLEADDREQAVELFQIVLGIDENNGPAQQGLTNLEAPLTPREFVPPQPPTPPEEVPEPEPAPAEEPEPASGGVEQQEGADVTMADAGPPPQPTAEPQAPSSSPGAKNKGRRRGLTGGLGSGMSLKKGLVAPSDTGKPMLGSTKPTLGGPRPGMRRPGLGAKTLGGEKPTLGLGSRKPTLPRRGLERVSTSDKPFLDAPTPSAQPVAEESGGEEAEGLVFDDDFSDAPDGESFFDDGPPPIEDVFADDAPSSAEAPSQSASDDDDFDLPDLPFASEDSPRLSMDTEEPESDRIDPEAQMAAGAVIGSFADAGGDESDSVEGGLRPAYAPDEEEDLFNLDSGADLFSDSGGDDLFSDDDGDDLFGDAAGEQDDLFNSPAEASQAPPPGADLFDDPEPASTEVAEEPVAGGGLFDSDGADDPFGDLFDEPSDSAGFESGDAPGAPPPGEDLFSEAPTESSQAEDGSFDSLFDEPTAEPMVTQEPGTDLFSEPEDPVGATPQDDLFATLDVPLEEEAAEQPFGDDLFSESPAQEQAAEPIGDSSMDDLFSLPDPHEPESASGEQPVADDLFGEMEAPASTDDDLFGEPQGETDDLFSSPAPAAAGDALFSSPSGEAEDEDLFAIPEPESGQEPLSEAPESDDLFSVSEPEAKQEEDFGLFDAPTEPTQSDDLFEESASVEPRHDAGDDLFGEPEGDSLFAGFDAPEESSQAAEAPEPDDLFSDLGSEPGPVESAGDLFEAGPTDTAGDLFAEPVAVATETATEPEDDMFSLGPTDDLFSEPTPAAPPEEPAPELNLSIPDPVPEAEPQSASAETTEETEDDLFGGGGDLFAVETIESEESRDVSGSGLFEAQEAPAPVADSGEDLVLDTSPSEEMARSTQPEEDQSVSDSPEFMKLLELTLPPTGDEAATEDTEPADLEEPSETSISDGMFQSDLFDSTSDQREGEAGSDEADLFESEPAVEAEPEPEPEPEPQEPAILGRPVVSLSIEDESSQSDIAEADKLLGGLADTDVATKIAAYRKSLESSPDNLVLRTRLADIHLKYGLLEDAVVQYRQIIRRNPDSISLLHRVIQAEFWNENFVEAGQSLLALGQLHLKRGEPHDAIDALQSVLSLDPLHFEARKVLVSVFADLDESKLAAHHLRQLAETALTKGEVQEAIHAFERLLEISDDPVFEERLAQIYEGQGDIERALASFQSLVGRYKAEERWEEAARVTERIVELDPTLLNERAALVELYDRLGEKGKSVEQQFQLGFRYQESGELESAISLYESVLEFQPQNFPARRHLVNAYLDFGQVSQALAQAESLTEHYLETRDHETAIDLYGRLVAADPENVELQERLVKFYTLAGDPENAKLRWIHISNLHEQNQRFDEAAKALQKALEIDAGQLDLMHRLALLYADKLNDKTAALGQLRSLFQQAPERLDAVKMYIDLLLELEQVAEAGQVLQQMEQAGGDSVEIKKNVITDIRDKVEANPADLKAKFNYGELCYHLGDLDHAIEQFQQTRRSNGYELMSYNMLGLCFAKKKGFNMLDLAIKQFKKGLEIEATTDQEYLELRYNLAMLQYQNGRPAEALKELKECYTVDIAYRDVRDWIQKIEGEMAG